MSDIQEEQKRLYKRAEENDYIVKDIAQYEENDSELAKYTIIELQDRINKAIEYIRKYGYEKQMEEDYLMNRVNLANYNCLLLDILKGGNK